MSPLGDEKVKEGKRTDGEKVMVLSISKGNKIFSSMERF